MTARVSIGELLIIAMSHFAHKHVGLPCFSPSASHCSLYSRTSSDRHVKGLQAHHFSAFNCAKGERYIHLHLRCWQQSEAALSPQRLDVPLCCINSFQDKPAHFAESLQHIRQHSMLEPSPPLRSNNISINWTKTNTLRLPDLT